MSLSVPAVSVAVVATGASEPVLRLRLGPGSLSRPVLLCSIAAASWGIFMYSSCRAVSGRNQSDFLSLLVFHCCVNFCHASVC